MYEENKYSFNWISLFIKVIIFVIFVLLAIWLMYKIVTPSGLNKEEKFQENINYIKEASEKYYTSELLPKETGDKNTITLQEMINKKLLLNIKDEKGNKCDYNKSYSEITKISDYYVLRIELYCNNINDYVYAKLK